MTDAARLACNDIAAIASTLERYHSPNAAPLLAALRTIREELERDEKDAMLWRAFNNDELSYFKVPLENRGSGEIVKGAVLWEVHWRGPDRVFFQQAVADAAGVQP